LHFTRHDEVLLIDPAGERPNVQKYRVKRAVGIPRGDISQTSSVDGHYTSDIYRRHDPVACGFHVTLAALLMLDSH
jgi:hypothetical protein